MDSFNLNVFTEVECLCDFRFLRCEIPIILGLSCRVVSKTKRNGFVCDFETVTCIVLRRLSSPCRWADIEEKFGMHSGALSEVFCENIESLYNNRSTLGRCFRADLLGERAKQYAEAIHENEAPLDDCFGFFDGTGIFMVRPGGPSSSPGSCYRVHKRAHCLAYQTITTPDGLVFHIHRPIEGRRSDMMMSIKSNRDQILKKKLLWTEGNIACWGTGHMF